MRIMRISSGYKRRKQTRSQQNVFIEENLKISNCNVDRKYRYQELYEMSIQ